jgi:hypothetical protein
LDFAHLAYLTDLSRKLIIRYGKVEKGFPPLLLKCVKTNLVEKCL